MSKKLICLFSFVLVLGLVSNAAGQIATNPVPADGSEQDQNWVALAWSAGAGAVSHNLYFGDNFADVQDGTGETFRGNLTVETFLIGFPGSPYPEGLAQDTTYYWRVDEVEADGTTIRTGRVWSFTVIGPTARHPSPPDGSRFVDPNVELSWSPGIGAIMHHVYFGDNLADVDAGTAETDKGLAVTTTYTPGTLASGTTYYWRIDEMDSATTHKGDIWKFQTKPFIPIFDPNLVGWWKLDDEGTGTVIDYSGYNRDGTLHGDPQWVAGLDGDALEFDGDDYVTIDGYKGVVGTDPFSITAWIRKEGPTGGNGEIVGWGSGGGGNRMEFRFNAGNNRVRIEAGGGNIQGDVALTAGEWIHVAVTLEANSTYTSDTGVNFYFDGVLVNRPNSDPDPIHPVADFDVIFGQRYNQSNDRWFIGVLDDIRVYDKALTAEDVGRAMLGDPRLAWALSPADQSEPFIEDATPMNWTPGDSAATHDVYLGISEMAVAGADISDTTGIYRGRQDANSYTPPEALEFNETYYWRIDEVEADGTTIYAGRVSSFTIANFIVVDSFEDYNDWSPNEIFATWIDGFFDPTNGSTAGYPDPEFGLGEHYAETDTVHWGDQAMPYFYDNSVGYSEATMTLSSARDWTKHGVEALSLWFQGYPVSVGSFTEEPGGNYTLAVRSAGNIAGTSDEFHFAYKQLTGAGSIIAKVENVRDTHNAAQAGVMIRDTLDPNSIHAAVVVTARNGVSFARRVTKADATTSDTQAGITAPQWLKIERDMAGTVTASYSADGSAWTQLGGQIITMSTPMYIGLVVASNQVAQTCEATFSNIQITGTVSPQWANQDIGILSNAPEPMYVAVANSGGTPAVVYHPDPNAVQINTWTEWNIDLKEFSGVNLTDVNSISIGFGDKANPQPGGSGKMYFDDIRLYRPRCMLELLQPAGDFNGDCMVDCLDLETMAADWLESDSVVATVAPEPTGLMAHFKFDGDATDSSGNNYHGVEKGGPTYVEGKFGQAISFDGFDDYVAIQDMNYAATTGHTEVTVCAWIRTSSPDYQVIATFDRDNYWRLYVAEQQAGPGQVGWSLWTSDGQLDYGSVPRVDDGQWHHVAGTFNSGTAIIYIDGNPESPAFGGATFGRGNNVRYGMVGMSTEALQFNGRTNNNGEFNGELDDVRIYHRALSEAEIRYLADDTPGDGELHVPVPSAANLYNGEPPLDRSVNFKDFALLADGWLDEQLWPAP